MSDEKLTVDQMSAALQSENMAETMEDIYKTAVRIGVFDPLTDMYVTILRERMQEMDHSAIKVGLHYLNKLAKTNQSYDLNSAMVQRDYRGYMAATFYLAVVEPRAGTANMHVVK